MVKEIITIKAIVFNSIDKVWEYYNKPEHLVKWNSASETWHTPFSIIDLKAGGRFLSRMEARDGSAGFDFSGKYDVVEYQKYIAYTLDDGRKVKTTFENMKTAVQIVIVFEAEPTHSIEQQREGWQAILNNFKKYAEMH